MIVLLPQRGIAVLRNGTTYQIQGDQITLINNALQPSDYRRVNSTWSSRRIRGERLFNYSLLAKYEEAEYSEYEAGSLLIDLSSDDTTLVEVLLGLTTQFYDRLMFGKKFPTGDQFTKGMNSLDWTTDAKIEVIDNYVTNKPQFKLDGIRVSFEELLTQIITVYESQLDGA